MRWLFQGNLTLRILVAMAAGIVLGLLINLYASTRDDALAGVLMDYGANGLFDVIGSWFIRLLQVIVVPLVFVSLVTGTAALENVRKLGRIGLKTLGLYLMTTALAISLALGGGLLLQPGAGFPDDTPSTWQPPDPKPLSEVLIELVPRNIFSAMAEGQMLPLILFSILLGIAVTLVPDVRDRLLALFQDFYEVVLKLTQLVIELAPIGVFALLTKTFATVGLGAIGSLASYFFTVLGVLLLHAFLVYPLMLSLLARRNPITFLRAMRGVQLFAFSTASSNATLPITQRTVIEDLGVPKSVASFTVPLGATINMDGTAIMQGVATVFVAQMIGVDLSLGQLLMVILTATLASIGTAGIPSVGLVMLTIVFAQIGLPAEKIGLLIGIDRLLDMVRTAVNVTGDATVSCIVARGEDKAPEQPAEPEPAATA